MGISHKRLRLSVGLPLLIIPTWQHLPNRLSRAARLQRERRMRPALGICESRLAGIPFAL